jgi:hypothetical protein
VKYVIEFKLDKDDTTWVDWGGGNTRRMAEVSEANCRTYLEELGLENSDVRFRKEC